MENKGTGSFKAGPVVTEDENLKSYKNVVPTDDGDIKTYKTILYIKEED